MLSVGRAVQPTEKLGPIFSSAILVPKPSTGTSATIREVVGNNSCFHSGNVLNILNIFMMQSETSLVEGITTRCALVIRSSESE